MGLTNSRAGATRVTLEEKRRRDREIAIEDGAFAYFTGRFVLPCFLICVRVAQYASAHQRREEEDLDLDREWHYEVWSPTCAHPLPVPRPTIPARPRHPWQVAIPDARCTS